MPVDANGDDIPVVLADIQGWNGFAVHKVGAEQFTFDNYHFEPASLTAGKDLYQLLPADNYTGSWYSTSMMKDPTHTYYEWNVDRYLPKWQYGDDVWDNDYRYSPESPAISVKGYYRNFNGGAAPVITWTDVTQLNIQGAVAGLAATGLALAATLAF